MYNNFIDNCKRNVNVEIASCLDLTRVNKKDIYQSCETLRKVINFFLIFSDWDLSDKEGTEFYNETLVKIAYVCAELEGFLNELEGEKIYTECIEYAELLDRD
jgi:hypothetical protein